MKQVNLHRLTLLNTRPLPQAESLNQRILAVNGRVLSCPTLQIMPSESSWINQLLPVLFDIEYAIFTSANAVHYCFHELQHHSIKWPHSIQNIAIGKATLATLENYGISVNSMPKIADSEHLLELSPLQFVTNKHILLVKGVGGRELISEQLMHRGAKVIELAVYKRMLPQANLSQLNSWWQEDAVDIILITSFEAMQNLFLLFEKAAHAWLKQKTWLVISPRLMTAAFNLGVKNIKLCNIETIIETLQQIRHDSK